MSRFAIRSNLAVLAMAATSSGLLAGPVMAATPIAAAPAAACEGHRGHLGGGDGLRISGLGGLSKAQLDSLKLDGTQQALVKTMRDGQRRLRDAMRASVVQRHGWLKAQLDSDALNPRALLEQSDNAREQLGSQARQVRDQWLAVWDSLNDAQRAQLTQILKARYAKGADRQRPPNAP